MLDHDATFQKKRNHIPFSVSPIHSIKPKLLDNVRIALRTNHYSLKTEESYVGWIKRFILFNNKAHPDTLGISKRYRNT
jgi:hypothetical protein